MKVHHVGYLVQDITAAIEAFAVLGYLVKEKPIVDKLRQAYLALICLDSVTVELIQPLDNSPLVELLKRYRNAPYHVCYSCEDLERTQVEFSEKGFVLLQNSEAAIIFNNKQVCFMMHREIGLVELIEDGE